MSQLWRSFVLILVTAAAVHPALACSQSQISFDAAIETALRALNTKSIAADRREQASNLLVLARIGSGPRWLGDRQRALDAALKLVGLAATEAFPGELSRSQREAQLKVEVAETLVKIDQMLAKTQISTVALAKTQELRRHAAELISLRQWSEASSLEYEALIALGADIPIKCSTTTG